MIRFGVIVTVVVGAVGLLIVGAVAGDLALVYVSIALAALALLLLIVGVAVWRDEVFASSARREERDLAPVGAVGHAGRGAAGAGTGEGWRDRPAPVPGPHLSPGAGPGGDTREFRVPIGALPERDAPGDRDRRSGEPRPTEQLSRPADLGGRPDREIAHWERPGFDTAAAERHGREAAAAERLGRDAAQGDRSAHGVGADWVGREGAPARRPDRAERYPTVFGPDRFEPADDPTRLAHRLDSISDFGRSADPDTADSARPPAGRPAADHRLPARAGADPLAGAGGQRRPPAIDPLAGSPSTGRAVGPDRVADADVPRPSRAAPSATVAAAAAAGGVPGTAAPGTTPPAMATAGPAAAATTKEPGSGGRELPGESGHGRPDTGRDRAESATAASREVPSAWPSVPSGADTRLAAESVSAAPAGVEVQASAPRSPAARDAGAAVVARPAAPSGASVETAGTGATSEPGGTAGTVPAGSATTKADAGDGEQAAGPAIGPDDQVSVVPGIARFHKADCILIRFLSEDDLELTTRREAEAAGCAPCRACRPDRPSAGS